MNRSLNISHFMCMHFEKQAKKTVIYASMNCCKPPRNIYFVWMKMANLSVKSISLCLDSITWKKKKRPKKCDLLTTNLFMLVFHERMCRKKLNTQLRREEKKSNKLFTAGEQGKNAIAKRITHHHHQKIITVITEWTLSYCVFM